MGSVRKPFLEQLRRVSVREQVRQVSTDCLHGPKAFGQMNRFDPSYRDHYADIIVLCLRLAERQRITVATPECTAILPKVRGCRRCPC